MKLFILILTIFLTGCIQNTTYIGPADYLVTVWSGGLPVAEYYVYDSQITRSSGGDYFFFSNKKFIRATGTITIEEL
jgi:hypothetical protein